jgi:regulator of protease activity HflC (stomatin/prohibitin superfamily)
MGSRAAITQTGITRLALLAIAAVAAAAAGGCVSHATGETEVGVLVCKISLGCQNKGVQQQLYPPGSTNFFAPFVRDFYRFDTKVQNLEMINDSKRGDRAARDELQLKTTDGNDIAMDVTVVWQIDPRMAPSLLTNVGESTEDVKEKLVRPMARTHVRDVLNELDSESVYNSDKRFEKAEKARAALTAALAPFGVNVTQVILHEHRFNPEYEHVIHDRKLAEQRAEQIKSEAEAASQESLRNLESARGKVAADIAAAEGRLNQARLGADAAYFAQQQNAEALLAERTAKAKAIAKRNEALRGVGGRAMVKLKVAEAIEGKSIVLVPAGQAGASFNRMDVNKMIDAFKDEPPPAPAAAEAPSDSNQ